MSGESPLGPGAFPDDAKRLSDFMHLAVLVVDNAQIMADRAWLSVTLADGNVTPFTVYESQADAMASKGAFWRLYVPCRVSPQGMSPRAAEAYLRVNRNLYDAGYRLPDPEAVKARHGQAPLIILPLRGEHFR